MVCLPPGCKISEADHCHQTKPIASPPYLCPDVMVIVLSLGNDHLLPILITILVQYHCVKQNAVIASKSSLYMMRIIYSDIKKRQPQPKDDDSEVDDSIS